MELVKGEHVSSGEAEAGVTPAAPWHPVTVSVGQGIGGVGEEILLLTLSLFKQSPSTTMRAFWGAFSAPLMLSNRNPSMWLFCLALMGLIQRDTPPHTLAPMH